MFRHCIPGSGTKPQLLVFLVCFSGMGKHVYFLVAKNPKHINKKDTKLNTFLVVLTPKVMKSMEQTLMKKWWWRKVQSNLQNNLQNDLLNLLNNLQNNQQNKFGNNLRSRLPIFLHYLVL